MLKDKIKEKRAESGLSQSQLALKLGVTAPAVAGCEVGRTTPKTEMLPKLAEVFDCTIDELFSEKNEVTESA